MGTLQKVTQVGLDCHRSFSRVTALDADLGVVCRMRLSHRDRTEMRKELDRFASGIPVVLESSFGWGWMADELAAAGLVPRLANATKVACWRSVRRAAKSDRLDSDLLAELPSQIPPWWEVWLAPPAVREQREWLRHRVSLVKLQTALKNRVHATLHRHGVLHDHADLFGRQGRQFLQLLIAEPSPKCRNICTAPLPASARFTLKATLQLFDQVRRQIAQVTRELRRQVSHSAAGERLRTIPGIGWVLAYTILAEVGDINRFRSAKHLCAYSLLVPRAWDTSEEERDAEPRGRHIGFMGRRMLKWAFIEAAHSAIRCGGRPRAIYDRRTDGGKRDRNRGIIAVAHDLCRTAYVVWKREVVYSQTPPPRPGSQRRHSRTRSVKGQPDLAMVVAG